MYVCVYLESSEVEYLTLHDLDEVMDLVANQEKEEEDDEEEEEDKGVVDDEEDEEEDSRFGEYLFVK